MPFLSFPWSSSSAMSSSSWRSSGSTPCCLPWWEQAVGGELCGSSFNKLEGRIWRTTVGLLSALELIVVVGDEQERSKGFILADRAGAHYQWCSWWGYGACAGGRWPALVAPSLILQVEWWPSFFLPAWKPKGRQPSFRVESMVGCCGGCAAPSGVVPGDGATESTRELSRTRLQSSFFDWGPLCKSS